MPSVAPACHLATAVGMLAIAQPGCGEEDGCDEPLRICDIGEEDCRDHVFVQTACARGFDRGTTPIVATITRDELAASLMSDAPSDEERLADEQRATAMRMLGLLRPGATSEDAALIEAIVEGVLAFYDRDTKSVTLVEDNIGGTAQSSEVFVLSHEFVHAQQDVDIGLAEFFDAFATSYDSTIALRCVTEGEAVLYSNLTLARQPGVEIDPQGFAEYYVGQQNALKVSAGDLANSDYLGLTLSFPYPFGGDAVTRVWFEQGDGGVLDLYDAPWRSTADVLRTLDGRPVRSIPEIELSAPALPEGWTLLADDTFGAWMTLAFADRNMMLSTVAEAVALDWLGDRMLVAVGPTAQDVALAWRFQFGDTAPAEVFGRVADQPPQEGAWSAAVEAASVTIVVAPDEASLAMWQTVFVAAFAPPLIALRDATVVGRVAPPLRPVARGRRAFALAGFAASAAARQLDASSGFSSYPL